MSNNYYDFYYKEPSIKKIKAAFRGKVLKSLRGVGHYQKTATRDQNGNPVIVITFNDRSKKNKNYQKPTTIYISNKPIDYNQYTPKAPEIRILKVFEITLKYIQDFTNGNITDEIRKNLKQYIHHYNKDPELVKKVIVKALNDKNIDVLNLILQLLEENKDQLVDNRFINEKEFAQINQIFLSIIESKTKINGQQTKDDKKSDFTDQNEK